MHGNYQASVKNKTNFFCGSCFRSSLYDDYRSMKVTINGTPVGPHVYNQQKWCTSDLFMKQNNLTLMFVENVYLTTHVYKRNLHFVHCKLSNKMNKMETKHERTWMLYRLTTERFFTDMSLIHTTQSHSHTLFVETFVGIPFFLKFFFFQPTLQRFT